MTATTTATVTTGTIDEAVAARAADKVRIATAALFNASIFDASILASMRVYASSAVPTAGTDCYTTVLYNPAFMDKLSNTAVAAVLAHECRHKAYIHAARAGDRSKELWNIACDFRINKDLHDQGFDFSSFKHTTVAEMGAALAGKAKLAEGAIMLDAQLADSLSAEDIYDVLAKQASSNSGQGQGQGASGHGVPSDDSGSPGKGSPLSGDIDFDGYAKASAGKTADQVQAEVTIEVAQAIEAAKAIGKLPGSLQRLANTFETPSVDWRSVLRRLVVASFGPGAVFGDYSYRRPSRRHTGGDIIMPSIMRVPNAPIAVAIDTSGSIGQRELDQFAGELRGIIKDVRPEKVYVVYCDAAVQHVDVFDQREPVSLAMHGGGGTEFSPVFAWLADNAPNVKCLVYLTDGYGSFDFTPPARLETVWGITSSVVAPWGSTVAVDIN